MARVDKDFKQKVISLVSQIPKGRVMTYGQIAFLCGAAWAAWEVGQIAHYGDSSIPWQRVVNKKGGLAKGYPGGIEGHKRTLEAEGFVIDKDNTLDVESLLWWPEK